MADTVHFSKLMQQSEDIFEVVLLAAKRAKQINALRMAKHPLPTINKRNDEEDFDETPVESNVDWDKMEKPTTLGINELLEGNVKFKRVEPDENDEKTTVK